MLDPIPSIPKKNEIISNTQQLLEMFVQIGLKVLTE